ncbi:MAG: hypothetical protein IPG12_15765 [Saprospiraceae bacterium]|nr:hypothetical protein [Saprospiraceae bacterium]
MMIVNTDTSLNKIIKPILNGCFILAIIFIASTFLCSLLLFLNYFNKYCVWDNGITLKLVSPDDIFSGFSALFSGLAFAGIIISIFIQRMDLNLQKKELQASRKEFTIKRITEVIYHQIGMIDKTFMKLPYYYIKYNWNTDPLPVFSESYDLSHTGPVESIEFKNGVEGVYSFVDGFKEDANNIISHGMTTIRRNQIECVIYNYSSIIYLGNSIIKSIDIIEELINDENVTDERNKLLAIFRGSIGEELLTFLKISFAVSQQYILDRTSKPLNNSDLNLSTMQEIDNYCEKFVLSFLKVDTHFRAFLTQRII